MEKNIYDILNEVETDIMEYPQENLSKEELERIKKHFKKSLKHPVTYRRILSVAAVAAVLCLSLFVTPLGTYAHAGVNTFLGGIGHFLGIDNNLDNYTTVVNQSVTKDGITVRLNEVILDGDELIVSSTITSETPFTSAGSQIDSMVYINGKLMNSATGGGSKLVNDHTMEEVMGHHLGGGELSGDINVSIEFSSYGEEKKGPWLFKFKTNGDELAKSTRAIKFDASFTLPNGQHVALTKYTSNALGQKIYFTCDRQGTIYDMTLKGFDDLGNNVTFYISHSDGNSGTFSFSNLNGNLNKDTKKLTLTPYAVKLPEQSGELSNDYQKVGDTFTIDLGK